jgi:hypothetical protein
MGGERLGGIPTVLCQGCPAHVSQSPRELPPGMALYHGLASAGAAEVQQIHIKKLKFKVVSLECTVQGRKA